MGIITKLFFLKTESMNFKIYILSTLPNLLYSRPHVPSSGTYSIELFNDEHYPTTASTEILTRTELDEPQLFKNSENLKILTSHNFKKYVLDGDENWLIMFYLSYCSRSQKLAPKFQEAAELLSQNFLKSDLKIKFGVVDAWNEFMLPYDYGIELGPSYPSVKFFSAYDKNVVRDYPHKLHSYHTESEDFRRVALDFVEMDQSDKNKNFEEEDEVFQETGSGYNFSGSGPGVNGPVGLFEESAIVGPVGLINSKSKVDDRNEYDVTETPEFILY